MLNQLLNSFCLLNVSMAAKNRMHNFLDLVNTTSPQPDTSSHLNQSKATATKSAIFDIFGEVISTPGKEESSSYSEIFTVGSPSLTGGDSLELSVICLGTEMIRISA